MRAIVVAADVQRGTFVLETEEGVCAVFCQHSGPLVQTGDMLEGAVTSRGVRVLCHEDGSCRVVGDSGPVSRDEALALMGSLSPAER